MRPFLDSAIQVPAGLPHDLAESFKAHRYQDWILRRIRPWLGGRILELGSGCGAMSRWFQEAERLVLTEPEPVMVGLLEQMVPRWFADPSRVRVQRLSLPEDGVEGFQGEGLDTVVSFNVLEHIEDDAQVLGQLAGLLRDSAAKGPRRLITFVPAHPFAYGAHDRYSGHFRRYDRARLRSLAAQAAPDAKLTIASFNFFGLWGWWLKGRVLGQAQVDGNTIAAFERLQPWLEPADTLLLRGLHLPLGQSLLCVLEWPAR
jgi:SAM-dependent methyltransferase